MAPPSGSVVPFVLVFSAWRVDRLTSWSDNEWSRRTLMRSEAVWKCGLFLYVTNTGRADTDCRVVKTVSHQVFVVTSAKAETRICFRGVLARRQWSRRQRRQRGKWGGYPHPQPIMGMGERHKLIQPDLRQSLGWRRVLVRFELKKRIWLVAIWYFLTFNWTSQMRLFK